MNNILKLNRIFTPNIALNECLDNYLEENINIITSSILVIISGKIATGKSMLLNKLAKPKDVVSINSLLGLNNKAPQNLISANALF